MCCTGTKVTNKPDTDPEHRYATCLNNGNTSEIYALMDLSHIFPLVV